MHHLTKSRRSTLRLSKVSAKELGINEFTEIHQTNLKLTWKLVNLGLHAKEEQQQPTSCHSLRRRPYRCWVGLTWSWAFGMQVTARFIIWFKLLHGKCLLCTIHFSHPPEWRTTSYNYVGGWIFIFQMSNANIYLIAVQTGVKSILGNKQNFIF